MSGNAKAGHSPVASSFFYLLALGLLCAFGPLCTDIYLPGLPAICNYYGIDTSTAQLSLTSCFLGLAFGQIVAGPISDALGRKKPMLISVAVFAVSSLLCATASSAIELIVWRFIQGFAGAGGLVISRSIACDSYQGEKLTRFMSLLMTIHSVAPVAGPVIGSALITFFSWHGVFVFLAFFGTGLLVLAFLSVPESLMSEKRQAKILSSFGSMFGECRNLRFMLYVCSLSFVMGGFFSYLAASPFVFQIIYAYSPLEYSLVFALIAVSISVTAFCAGRLAGRTGDRRILSVALILMMLAGMCILIFSIWQPSSSIPVIVALMLYCTMMGTSQTVGFGIVMSSRRGGAGSASGLYGVMNFLFGALMTPLAGILGNHSMLPLGLCLLLNAAAAFGTYFWAESLKK